MATDEVGIYNLALSAVGVSADVATTTEASREAETCRLWFDEVRDQVLRAAPWPVARAYKRLALISSRDTTADWVSTDPEPGWLYAYQTPSDMVRPIHTATYANFTMGTTSTNSLAIMSNEETPILFYTKRQTNIELWSADLVNAVAFALAAHICMSLTGKPQRAQLAAEQANQKIMAARANEANSTQFYLEAEPSWLAARGTALLGTNTRYVYPDGPLIVAQSYVT